MEPADAPATKAEVQELSAKVDALHEKMDKILSLLSSSPAPSTVTVGATCVSLAKEISEINTTTSSLTLSTAHSTTRSSAYTNSYPNVAGVTRPNSAPPTTRLNYEKSINRFSSLATEEGKEVVWASAQRMVTEMTESFRGILFPELKGDCVKGSLTTCVMKRASDVDKLMQFISPHLIGWHEQKLKTCTKFTFHWRCPLDAASFLALGWQLEDGHEEVADVEFTPGWPVKPARFIRGRKVVSVRNLAPSIDVPALSAIFRPFRVLSVKRCVNGSVRAACSDSASALLIYSVLHGCPLAGNKLIVESVWLRKECVIRA